jgi:hypothetical protein
MIMRRRGLELVAGVFTLAMLGCQPPGEPAEPPAPVQSTASQLTGMDGSIEYAVDAPWRIEPRGSAGSYAYPPIPIQVSLFDEDFSYAEGSSGWLGDVCQLEVTEYDTAGGVLAQAVYPVSQFKQVELTGSTSNTANSDTTMSTVTNRSYWDVSAALPPWRGYCRPYLGECSSRMTAPAVTTEWHGLVLHRAYSTQPGTRRTMRFRLAVSRYGVPCGNVSERVQFTNWASVLFAPQPLPRFGDDWTYGDLHYHSQGTDNEGEVGYNYRGVVQAMSAMGLDFAFATEHASDARMIADMRIDWELCWDTGICLYDDGTILQGLRDMSATRFQDHALLINRTLSNRHELEPLRTTAYPTLFVGGEVDVVPELDSKPPLPYSSNISQWQVPFGNGLQFDLHGMCERGIPYTPACNESRLFQPIGSGYSGYIVNDAQALDEYFAGRQHLIYLPRTNTGSEFVSSSTSKYGGGTRPLALSYGLPMAQEIASKGGIAFLAHPLSGGGGGIGPGMVPYSPRQLDQAFAQQAIVGLQFWNEDGRLYSSNSDGSETIYEAGYDRDLWGYGTPGHDQGMDNHAFELRPSTAMADVYDWRWETTSDSVEWMLHHGGALWDRMLLMGLDPSRTSGLSWLAPGQPRRLFVAGGSDAHGDFNYRREGYAIKTDRVTDDALGKVRNLVQTGVLSSPSQSTRQALVFDSVREGRFSVTDGPALRIAIDRNANDQIDSSDTGMGGVLSISPGASLPLLVEWQSSSEFGVVEQIDLYVGVYKSGTFPCSGASCVASKTYAPPSHGVRTAWDRPGTPVTQGGSGPRLLQDGYWTPDASVPLRLTPSTLAGTQKVVLNLDSFPIGEGTRGERFYVRAFARTRPTSQVCGSSDAAARNQEIRRGLCVSRYALTNPIWAIPSN